MRRLLVAAAITAALTGRPASADFSATGIETGNGLLAKCAGSYPLPMVCSWYVAAIADVMANRNAINGYRACIPNGVVTSQLRDITVQYLRTNAATRHLLAAGLVAEALQQAFPCQ